jgi:hypothetical protein
MVGWRAPGALTGAAPLVADARLGGARPARLEDDRNQFSGRDAMADHTRGEMDIAEQEKTFAGFTKIAVYVVVIVAAILLLLTTRI